MGFVVSILALTATACGTDGDNTLAPSQPEESAETSQAPSEPSAAASVTSDAYTVGDRIQLGNEEYFTVVEVDLAVDTTGMVFQPDAGNKFIAALVAIEGINPEGATYNPFFFTVRDDQGFEYNFSPFGKEPALQSSNDLAPGDVVQGWVNFEVPGTAASFVLVYAPGFFNEPVQVSLN
jgi:hypothetical protein